MPVEVDALTLEALHAWGRDETKICAATTAELRVRPAEIVNEHEGKVGLGAGHVGDHGAWCRGEQGLARGGHGDRSDAPHHGWSLWVFRDSESASAPARRALCFRFVMSSGHSVMIVCDDCLLFRHHFFFIQFFVDLRPMLDKFQ